jgi:hypothetical protein
MGLCEAWLSRWSSREERVVALRAVTEAHDVLELAVSLGLGDLLMFTPAPGTPQDSPYKALARP